MDDEDSRREILPDTFFDEMVRKGEVLPCPHSAIRAAAWASPTVESEYCCRTGEAWEPFFHPRGEEDELPGLDLLLQHYANTRAPPGEELYCSAAGLVFQRRPDGAVCHVGEKPRIQSPVVVVRLDGLRNERRFTLLSVASLALGTWSQAPDEPETCIALSLTGNPEATDVQFCYFVSAEEHDTFVKYLWKPCTPVGNTLAARKALFRRMDPRRGQQRMNNADRESQLARWASAPVAQGIQRSESPRPADGHPDQRVPSPPVD